MSVKIGAFICSGSFRENLYYFPELFDEKIKISFFTLSDQNLENKIFTKYYYPKYFEVMHEFRGLEIKLR